jgi:hypothetical protein
MKYSTTKAVVNKIFPGAFRNGTAGLGMVRQPVQYQSGVLGRGLGDDSSGVSLSTDMMLGLAIGAAGVVLWCKNQHKIRGGARA